MRLKYLLATLLIGSIAFFVACQKESSFEIPPISKGSLKDSVGNCLVDTVYGIYKQDSTVGGGNTVKVKVNVTKAGTYKIVTDTVSGLSFTGIGSFPSAGNTSVILRASGRPTVEGFLTFRVKYDSSECEFFINVLRRDSTGGGGGGTAQGSLGGSPGACTSANVAGTYTQGTALASGNTVTIQVNVTTIGTYTISTPSTGGMIFSASGNFTTTGIQNVTLVGSGTPTTAGSNTINVSFGGTTCSFTCNVNAGVVLDYFPTTTNSNWSYQNVDASGTIVDTAYAICLANNLSANGNSYRILRNNDGTSGYFRKASGNYYQYEDSVRDIFTNPVPGIEFIILKDNVPVNTTWESAVVSGSIMGIPTNIKYSFKILAASGSSITVGTLPTFTDVIQVQQTLLVQVGGIGPWTPTINLKNSFQRGVGLIKQDDLGAPGNEVRIRRWQVL
jgi:hypothetical protein